MTYMGIDLGYREETNIVIFDDKNVNNRFTFSSIRAETDFEDVINKLYELAKRHNIPSDYISSPRHPAVEHELRKRLPTLEQMLNSKKVEKM